MTQSKLTALAVCALVQLHVSLECHAFTARLTRPWRFKRGHLRIRTRQQPKSVSAIPAATLEQHTSPVRNSQVSDSSLHLSSTDDIGQAERAEEEKRAEIEVFPAVVLGANSTMMEATSSERLSATLLTETEPSTGTIRSQLGLLTGLTRPSNFPGIVVFHVLGIYLALSSVGRMDAFVHVLLGNPSMWLVFSSIVLVSSTSMVVNDYYDAKLGRDKNTDRPLAKGTLSFPLVRRYLSYLYAASLLCSALLPGAPARLSVLFALMLTYKYTNSLKPITWVKNAVCAFLIAFAPLTSGSAALFLVSEKAGMMSGLSILGVGSIWRVAAMVSFGKQHLFVPFHRILPTTTTAALLWNSRA
jgi:hypothetical protein